MVDHYCQTEHKMHNASSQNGRRARVAGHLSDNFRSLEASDERELRSALFRHYYGYSSEEEFLNDNARHTQEEKAYILTTDLPQQIFSRITTTRERIIPWLDDQIGLSGKIILEIGAGTGCSVVALAEQCDRVTGVDIQENDLEIAKIRSKLYGIENVDFINLNAIQVFDVLEPRKYNVVIFYACLEHMTMEERIKSLSSAWSYLGKEGYLVIIESPNRLFWYDYHTSFLPFFHILPYDLALQYAKRSSRASLVKSLEGLSKDDAYTCLARWGTCVGYHEIEVALQKNILDLKFLEDLISFEIRTNGFLSDEERLTRETFIRLFELRQMTMPPIGFFNINIDMILQKTF